MKHQGNRQPEEEAMDDEEDIGKAKLNPASEFKRPMDVVGASDITAADKLAILRAWEADERALQRAESEGMGGGEHAHLHRVQEALTRLQEEGPTFCLARTAPRSAARDRKRTQQPSPSDGQTRQAG